MQEVRKLGLAALIAGSSALALFGCKKETFQTPGANQEELNREGQQTAHDHADDTDRTFGKPGATPEEVNREQKEQEHAKDEPAKKSTTLSTPGESLGEAKGKGIGGGPIVDDTARPSQKTSPPASGTKGDRDGPLETPGATEEEVSK